MAEATGKRRPHGAASWIVIGTLAIVAATLGVVLASGLSLADAAGRPLDVPGVSITPMPSGASSPSPGPTSPSTGQGSDDPYPEVVTAPDPVTVTLDDHGGDNHGGGGSDDGGNSGKGGNK